MNNIIVSWIFKRYKNTRIFELDLLINYLVSMVQKQRTLCTRQPPAANKNVNFQLCLIARYLIPFFLFKINTRDRSSRYSDKKAYKDHIWLFLLLAPRLSERVFTFLIPISKIAFMKQMGKFLHRFPKL